MGTGGRALRGFWVFGARPRRPRRARRFFCGGYLSSGRWNFPCVRVSMGRGERSGVSDTGFGPQSQQLQALDRSPRERVTTRFAPVRLRRGESTLSLVFPVAKMVVPTGVLQAAVYGGSVTVVTTNERASDPTRVRRVALLSSSCRRSHDPLIIRRGRAFS